MNPETHGSGDHGESIPSSPAQPSPAQPSPAQRESWQQVDSGQGGDSQPANPANQLQSKCQGREMEMNVSKGSGGRLSWVRGCGPVCVAAAGWRDLLATVETSARCSAVGGHRPVVTLPSLLPHHLHTTTCSYNLVLGVRHSQCQQ